MKRQAKPEHPRKEKVDRKEALKRMKAFPKRSARIITAIREGANRKHS